MTQVNDKYRLHNVDMANSMIGGTPSDFDLCYVYECEKGKELSNSQHRFTGTLAECREFMDGKRVAMF